MCWTEQLGNQATETKHGHVKMHHLSSFSRMYLTKCKVSIAWG